MKFKMDNAIRTHFEDLIAQIVSLGPKLRLSYNGGEAEISELMTKSFKKHLLISIRKDLAQFCLNPH